MVWLFGSAAAIHIDASDVVFGLIGFLLFVGIFRREWVGLIVATAYFCCDTVVRSFLFLRLFQA